MRTFFIALLIPLLAGCVAGKEQYDSYLAAQKARDRQQAVEEQKRSERWQKMAEACKGDPDCIKDVAREATLSDAFAALQKSGSGGSGDIEQFRVQAHPATAAALGIANAVLPQAIQGAVQIRQSDNARDVSINANTMQAQTQQAAIGLGVAAVNANASAVNGLAAILPDLPPNQSYSAGGHMSLGDMQNGDNAGRDNVRDGSQVGHNTGAINTGTQIENDGNMGENNRQDAPGPFTDNNNGPRCEGPLCQQVTPPVESEGSE